MFRNVSGNKTNKKSAVQEDHCRLFTFNPGQVSQGRWVADLPAWSCTQRNFRQIGETEGGNYRTSWQNVTAASRKICDNGLKLRVWQPANKCDPARLFVKYLCWKQKTVHKFWLMFLMRSPCYRACMHVCVRIFAFPISTFQPRWPIFIKSDMNVMPLEAIQTS
jgi:hypothetical protein